MLHISERGGHRYNRILKPRQLGFTTEYCIDYLDEALWVPGMSCGIIAHEQKFNDKIFAIVKRAFDNLPPGLRPKTKTNTKYAYEFVERFDGYQLDSSIYVSTDVRSGTVQKLHITEAAFIKDWEKIVAGAKQAVPKTGSITEETTANGFNIFFDNFEDSMEKKERGEIGEYDYMPFFYPWFINPEYSLPGVMPEILPSDEPKYGKEIEEKKKYNLTDGQLLWRRWKINELRSSGKTETETVGLSGLQLFRQEYPGNMQEAFQSGAGNVFDTSNSIGVDPIDIKQCQTLLKEYQYQDETISIMLQEIEALMKLGVIFWDVPKQQLTYVIGGDPSDGDGSDYSPFSVWDIDHNQIAQFYNKVRPDVMAEIAARVGKLFNNCIIGIENNMLSCVLFLSKIYHNVFTEVKIDKTTKVRTKTLGFTTSSKTRDPMIDEFKALYEDGELGIKSRKTLLEMKTFVKKDNGKREHATGKHDDVLFGDFIAIQMIKLRPKGVTVHTANTLN